MKKILFKGETFALSGTAIKKGSILKFKARGVDSKDFNITDLQGFKVISIFPDINTRICDLQTLEIIKMAADNPQVHFVSITMNDIATIQEWCAAKYAKNVNIFSDAYYREFAQKTNLLIVAKDILARGFILLDEKNVVVDTVFNDEVAEMPDFAKVTSWLQHLAMRRRK